MKSGTYFRPETKELATIKGENDTLPGSGWQLLTDDTEQGLMAARALLVERGLVDKQGARKPTGISRSRRRRNGSCPAGRRRSRAPRGRPGVRVLTALP